MTDLSAITDKIFDYSEAGTRPTITQKRELSYGEKAVGATFNPSGNEDVTTFKSYYASIIDMLNDRRDALPSEKNRLLSIAITEAQTAQMWAVKAIMWGD